MVRALFKNTFLLFLIIISFSNKIMIDSIDSFYFLSSDDKRVPKMIDSTDIKQKYDCFIYVRYWENIQ